MQRGGIALALAALALSSGCAGAAMRPVPAVADNASQSRFSTQSIAVADGRMLEVEIGLPPAAPGQRGALRGIILFAHGANLAPEHYRALTLPWTLAGYAVISPRFLDSESHPQRETQDRARILATRLADYQTTAHWAEGKAGPGMEAGPGTKSGAMAFIQQHQTAPIFAAGHSYGAYLAQILGGATVIAGPEEQPASLAVPERLRGIIALSPPPAFAGFSPSGSWAGIARPMLVQTGTSDISPPFVTAWEQHLGSHCEAPPGQSWSVVYPGIDHYFSGLLGRLAEVPEASALTSMDRFTKLSLVFMQSAADGPAGLAGFDAALRQHNEADPLTPPVNCPRSE